MKATALFALQLFLSLVTVSAQTSDYADLKAKAEAQYAEGSFAKSHEVYQQAKSLSLSTADARWVDFRLADTLWRSDAATQHADNTVAETARKQLEALIRDIDRTEDHDRVWVEVQESLGDFLWTRRNWQDWGGAWSHYQAALDWWAGAADIESARARYLKIIWRISKPPVWQGGGYGGFYNWSAIPPEVYENAIKIAQSPNDQAHAHFLMAMSLQYRGGDWEQRQRIPEEFEGAVKPGKTTDWYDFALYNYGEWMMNNGRAIPLKSGGWSQEPDYKKALELFRRLVAEFKEGETTCYNQAKQNIKNITEPSCSVSVGNVFLPDSEIQYALNWRNVKRVELALYAVDLTRDVNLEGEHNDNWLQSISLAGREKVKSWSRETKDQGDYKPGGETARLDGKLKPGAYVIEARAGGQSARDLILVTDDSLVLKSSGRQALVYVCNALDGSPVPGANVKLWERYYEGNHWHWLDSAKAANGEGIAVFDLVRSANNEQLYASAISQDRQAFSDGYCNFNYGNPNRDESWRIYAFTDRPAYRPGETVRWKFIARKKKAGAAYITPEDEVVEFQIDDPRGVKVMEDKAALNAFGAAWRSLELNTNLPLGEFHVTFWNQGRTRQIGNATLFRLEEYKLPEFKVTVQTPEENGRKKAFRLGEKVEVSVQADYYFGGPVGNASVELIVYQDPYYHYWRHPHDYPWLYDDFAPGNRWGRRNYGGGQIIKRETIQTDASGKAALTFETPRNPGQDYEYRIEARVTDASRREITANGTVRVTGQRYYVYPEAEHNLYRPQDKVSVNFKALDANEQPVVTEGTVKVTRDYWFEIWLDSKGREVKGDELKNFQSRGLIFPPPPKPDENPWQLKFRGYEHDEVLTRTLKTDTNGECELSFTPERDGYYRIAWSSEDNGQTNASPVAPITAETTVWAASVATTELGYRHGGVEIIVDKDTFRVGQKAPVMLTVPTNDRYVLFSVEGEDLYSYQLIHLSGTVKLIELPVEEKHVPNIFLSATLVSDRQIFTDTKQVVVPPTKNFLTMDVKADREQYRPQEPGTFTITTRDDHGEPVSAEVAFGLVDESVFYIQSEYAGDPRQFFYEDKRAQQIQTQSTFNQKSYAKLVEGDEKQLIDVRDLEASRLRKHGAKLDRNGTAYFRDGFEFDDASSAVTDAEKYPEGMKTRAKSFESLGFSQSMAGGGGAGGAFYHTLNAATLAPMLADVPVMGALSGRAPGMIPPGVGEESAVQVRSDFRSTVFWQPDVKTDKDGKATLKVTYPDSLTSWKATARAVTTANQFGIASTGTRTKEPLIVRLESPRFLVVGDKVTISAVVNNNTDAEIIAKVQLQPELPGFAPKDTLVSSLKVPANGEARADWQIVIREPGEAKLKVTARGGKFADAMEKTCPIYEHGIEKFISKSGKVRGDDVTVKLELPAERKKDSTTLSVQVTPSLAVTMLDALPYLIDYPYGCTEQTMSRFLPAAITAKTLKDLGLKPDDVMGHLFGGIETNSAAATHPKGKHDLHQLDDITKKCLERLYDFQHSDGGWGWWKEGDSDHFMTAYVVWGLSLGRDADLDIKSEALKRGADYLDKRLVEEESSYDEQAWMLHALSVYHAPMKRQKPGQFESKAFDNLWTNRERLNAYTRALLALSAHNFGFNEQAQTLIANLENGVKIDNSPDTSVLINQSKASPTNAQPSTVIGTAHWGEDGIYWRWSDGGVEATAFALRALLAIDPHNKLVEPVSNWLIKNRRGAQWSNTRDTAITVLAMNDNLRASGELNPEFEYELFVNGQSIASRKISSADVFNAPSRFAIDPKLIRDGQNDVRIVRRSGKGSIYFAADAAFFSLEEPVTPAGNEIFVKRQYYKLAARPTLLKGIVYDRELLNDGETVKSGERVETVLTIEAKNNYEYLLFEDLKPAGLEAVQVRSGESLYAYELKSGAVERKFGQATNGSAEASASATKPESKFQSNGRRKVSGGISPIIRPKPVTDENHTGRSRWVYQELRDRKVALFIDKLPQGVWEIKYDLRAEVPGEFHALPVVGHAMYVPEIRCNGAEVRITVEDAK